jgi:predicted nucleic acid-binding protein
MTSRVFVDTNVWVYTVDDSDPDKRARAREVVAPSPEKDVVVSAQVLGEFYVTVRRKLAKALTKPEAQALVQQLRRLPVVAIDGDLVSSAIEKAAAWQVSYWDALILAAAETSGCEIILSEDLGHGRAYGSVRAENPFIDAPDPAG